MNQDPNSAESTPEQETAPDSSTPPEPQPEGPAQEDEQPSGEYSKGVRLTREGIEISDRLAADKLPPGVIDPEIEIPYQFPDPRRRRIAGIIYLAFALFLLIWVPSRPMLLVGVGLLVVIGVWSWLAAWPLQIDQYQALQQAAGQVNFVVGPASAAITFHGWRSRPHWNIILYSVDLPTTQRALVRIDAVTGSQVDETYVEEAPPPRGWGRKQ